MTVSTSPADPATLDVVLGAARTARSFTDRPVDLDLVTGAWDLARLGPTAVNGQPLRMLVLASDDARATALRHVSRGNRAQTASAPLVLVLAADLDFHEQLPRLYPVAPSARDWYADPATRERAAVFNAGLQIGYLLVALRAAGLAVGPMEGYDREGLDAELLAGRRWRSLVLVNVGHPATDAWGERLPRLDREETVVVR